MSEISGSVELFSDKRKGKMTIRVTSESGLEKDHHVPQDKMLLVHTGDYVTAGDPLTQGPLVPHDILRIKGEDALYTYMLDEVQNVYRAQGVPINDKHIEVMLRQMLSKVLIESPGDTSLLPNEVIDKHVFKAHNTEASQYGKITDPGDTSLPVGALVPKTDIREANAQTEAAGKKGAKAKRARQCTARPLLLGITKASLQSRSWLSGASFQETTKVLTEAALRGAVDNLEGLKENVLLGHLIPAGTGFRGHLSVQVKRIAPVPAAPVSDFGQSARWQTAAPAAEVEPVEEPVVEESDATIAADADTAVEVQDPSPVAEEVAADAEGDFQNPEGDAGDDDEKESSGVTTGLGTEG